MFFHWMGAWIWIPRIRKIEADAIITAASHRPNVELFKAMEGKAPEIYLLGVDDKEPNSIMNAIGNDCRVAKAI